MSAVERVEAALDAIDRLDESVNAFTVVLTDQARATARAVDRGEIGGPLAGVPVAIKDHVWMRGAPATNGSLAYADFVPDEDCVCVARLRAAGAVLVGKTNNPEFCYRGITEHALFGLTRNPRDLERTPGGSSGGSAAAVAAGMVPLALGTDGGGRSVSRRRSAASRATSRRSGSCRSCPASAAGLRGRSTGRSAFRGWPSLSVDGPLGRSVGEVALMLAAMAGAAADDDLTWPVPVGDVVGAAARAAVPDGVVAYSADLSFGPVEPDVRAVFERALGALSDAGCRLEEAAPPTGDPTALWNAIACAEGYASERPLLAEWEDRMTEGTAEIVRAGEGVTAAQYLDAQHERAAFARAWAEFFARYELLLTRAMQMTAFPVGILSPEAIDGRPVDPFFDDWVTFCLPANLTGQPAASVPIGLGDEGLPVQVMGPRWADAAVLGAAAAVEAALPGYGSSS